MPKVSYIAGVAPDEMLDRAKTLPERMPVNYLDLTKGEMQLTLMLRQAQILANYYGDPEIKKAVTMLSDALQTGVHGMGPVHIGAASALVRKVAKNIDDARRQIAPASRFGNTSIRDVRVTGIGQTLIPYADRFKACAEAAKSKYSKDFFKQQEALLACKRQSDIEKILNDGLEDCGQYLAYGFLPNSNQMPNLAAGKIRDQLIAIQSIAQIGGFSADLCAQWLNVGMMQANVQVAKIQPLGWIQTNARLTMISDAGQAKMIQFLEAKGAKMSGAEAGNLLARIIRDNQRQGIQDPVTIALAIFGAISALLGKITDFLLSLRAKAVTALQAAKGFGTEAFGPQQGDFLLDTGAGGNGTPPPTPPKDNTALYLGGAALLAVLALKK